MNKKPSIFYLHDPPSLPNEEVGHTHANALVKASSKQLKYCDQCLDSSAVSIESSVIFTFRHGGTKVVLNNSVF